MFKKVHSRMKLPKESRHSNFIKSDTESYNKLPIIFSLEKVQVGTYCFSKLETEEKAAFSDSIFKRKSLSWLDIIQSPKHGLGSEKIPKDKIKAPIPKFITEEEDFFLVLRFHGKMPMIGYREKNIFFVLWFDRTHTLYS